MLASGSSIPPRLRVARSTSPSVCQPSPWRQFTAINKLDGSSNSLGHRPIILVRKAFVPASFVPERELNPIPESKLVKDDAQMIFHHILRSADRFGNFAILEALGDERDDLLLPRARDTASVETVCW